MNQLYLVRHGENTANLTKELSHRRVDYSLTAKGVLQAEQTARYFKAQRIDEIYTSPLKRARETAVIIASQLNLPITEIEAFREVNVGSLEGRPVTQMLWNEHNEIIHAWFQGRPEARFPGGENHLELIDRFTRALIPILVQGNDRKILLVGHGGTFILSIPTLCPGVRFNDLLSVDNANCSVTEIDMDYEEGCFVGRLKRWADSSHLSGEAAELIPGTPQPGELKN